MFETLCGPGDSCVPRRSRERRPWGVAITHPDHDQSPLSRAGRRVLEPLRAVCPDHQQEVFPDRSIAVNDGTLILGTRVTVAHAPAAIGSVRSSHLGASLELPPRPPIMLLWSSFLLPGQARGSGGDHRGRPPGEGIRLLWAVAPTGSHFPEVVLRPGQAPSLHWTKADRTRPFLDAVRASVCLET